MANVIIDVFMGVKDRENVDWAWGMGHGGGAIELGGDGGKSRRVGKVE